ncbi:MAG TPA: phosphodiester glycosidase family protein [Thermoleophilaceae bacterium]|nr:phosphodiester glycosidase family protein [Thermoleophilaceae bacterium]
MVPLPLPSVRSSARLERLRVGHPDGACTTLHVASYHRGSFAPRLVALRTPAPLVRWCEGYAVQHALVGGFFTRPGARPLGQLVVGGEQLPSVPFDSPWDDVRACLHIRGDAVWIARRNRLGAAPAGDLLQAGPLLVAEGRSVIDGSDGEGFSAGSRQFDSDITVGRYPRAALAIAGDKLLAVACDGRSDRDSGMTLGELADSLVALGAKYALNLDGGGSTSLVHEGRLRNRPREAHGIDLLDGRPVATAVVFEER